MNFRMGTLTLFGAALLLFSGITGCRMMDEIEDKPMLLGTLWELDDNQMPGAPKAPKGMRDVTMRLLPEGRIVGCSGVNRYSGEVEINQDLRTFKLKGPLTATRMAGPGQEFEQYFLSQMAKVDGYRFKGDDLELLAGDTVIAEFEQED